MPVLPAGKNLLQTKVIAVHECYRPLSCISNMYPHMKPEIQVSCMADEVIMVGSFHPVKWGSFVFRGLIAFIIGILVLVWTNLAVEIVASLIGILVVLAAVITMVLALKSPSGAPYSAPLLIMGVLGLVAGVLAILHPWTAAAVLTLIIAVLILVAGFLDLSLAIFHPEFTDHRWLLGLAGALSVILGGIFIFLPTLGALVLVAVYLGIFVLIYGILSIIIGVMIRGEQKKTATV